MFNAQNDWRHAFVHEIGHAVMGKKQGIRCYGVFLLQSPLKAAVLTEPLPPPSGLSNKHHLYLAAGSAAERNSLGYADSGASREDRRLFGKPPNTTFDKKVQEAQTILLGKKAQIERIASRLSDIVRNAGGDFSGFPVQRAGIGNDIKNYWVLLSDDDLKEELEKH
jgi:hypothetical protein